MKTSEIMTRPAVTVGPDTTLDAAVRLMLDRRISGLPVVDPMGRLVGMLTEGDLLRRVETGTDTRRRRWLEFLASPGHLASDYVQTHGRLVAEVMTPTAVSVTEDVPIEEVVALMQARRIKRVPVLRNGSVVGVVSRADLIRTLAQRLHVHAEPPQTDEEIGKRVADALRHASWTASRTVTAAVQNGVVVLRGTIFDDRERQAFLVLVENVAGVRGVQDEIIWIDPVSGMTVVPDNPPRPA